MKKPTVKKAKFDIDHDDPCNGCPIKCSTPKSKAKIIKGAPFLLVGKAPSHESLKNRRIIPPKATRTVQDGMGLAGLPEDMFSWASAVRCEYDMQLYNAAERREIEYRCRQHLLRVIEHCEPEAVIPMGADASRQVFGRQVKITKVRGLCSESDDFAAKIIPITDPVAVSMFPQNGPILQSDCEAVGRLYEYDYDAAASEQQAFGDYTRVTDLQFLIDEDPEMLSFDVETKGLQPYRKENKILTMQFCPEPGRAYLLSWDHPDSPAPLRARKRLLRQLRQLLCSPDREIVGQNLKFDASWLLCKFGIQIRIGHDTQMMAATVNENLMPKDLDTLTKIYAPEMAGYADRFNATYDKQHMEKVPLVKIVDYGCGDTDAALRVCQTLLPQVMSDTQQWNSYRYVSIPGLNGFLSFETDGMLIDEPEFDQFEEILREQVTEEYSGLIKKVHRSIRKKWMDPKKPQQGLSFGRADFTRDVLFNDSKGFKLSPKVFTKSTEKLEAKDRLPSISTKDHLPFFFDRCPFTMELSGYIKNERLLGTNVVKFKENYLYDSKIYPIYGLATAVTGRCLTGDVVVVTNFGPMTMDQIGGLSRERPAVLNGGLKVATHKGRLRNVTDFISNGRKEVYELRTAEGRSVKATANHPFWTPDGWRKLASLTAGGTVYAYPEPQWDTSEEEWRDVAGRQGYQVSSHGRVKRWLKTKNHFKLVSPHKKGEWGHVKVRLGRGEKDTPVHTLVAETFLGPRPEGTEVTHLNGLPAYNRVTNLHYGTSKENSAHAVAHGRSRRGETHEQCVYSNTQVQEIRKLHEEGQRFCEIGRATGVPAKYIRDLCVGNRRKEPVGFLVKDTVVSIERIGARETYDISVEQDHSFVANGLVVHNTNSRDPNGQNFPKRGKAAKAYRRIFIPPPGYIQLEADLSQAELRISADMANELVMLGIYRNDGDIHRSTYCEVMGIAESDFFKLSEEEQGLGRFKAKAINFGFIYGMWWKKFTGYAKTQYGVDFTDREAKEIREAFFRLYPGLEAWHKAMRSFASQNGYVRSYDGRVRHLPQIYSDVDYIQQEAQRQAINSPVQEFASSLGVMSLSRITTQINPDYLRLKGFVHDALYAIVPLEYTEWGAKMLKYYMESNPIYEWFNRRLKVDIKADVGFGMNGADVYEMKTLDLHKRYDFGLHSSLPYKLPKQKTPPNDGRLILPRHLQSPEQIHLWD